MSRWMILMSRLSMSAMTGCCLCRFPETLVSTCGTNQRFVRASGPMQLPTPEIGLSAVVTIEPLLQEHCNNVPGLLTSGSKTPAAERALAESIRELEM